MEYESFIKSKGRYDVASGFDGDASKYGLFDFQQTITEWALKRGRAAIFADTGLGKTAMQTAWANEVYEHTNENVLILAPLCVAQQTVQEAAKFGINVNYCRNQDQVKKGISIANYEMLEHFSPELFSGIVIDESSILKSHTGRTRQAIINAFSQTPYRLSCTATPSPNDFMELGNQSDFLGVMNMQEMLATYFTHDGSDTSKWRLKGHGKVKFWEWLAQWSICIRSPADLGFDGSRYVLPPLNIIDHTIESDEILEGHLFHTIAQTLSERRHAKRSTLEQRIALATEIANSNDEPCIVWCHLNDESEALAKSINGAVEVTGSMSLDEKERNIMAFTNGDKRVLVSKASICGFGMNWQHCNNMIFAGLNDSFEQYYQAVRRSYRFGQTRQVNVHRIAADIEGAVMLNIIRKQDQVDTMAGEMIEYMRELTKKQIYGAVSNTEIYNPQMKMIIPNWIRSEA